MQANSHSTNTKIDVNDRQIPGGGENALLDNSMTKQENVHADMMCMTTLLFLKVFPQLSIGRLLLIFLQPNFMKKTNQIPL